MKLHTPSFRLLAGLLVSLLAITVSCKKFITVDLPIDKVTSATVFASDESATAAVLGVYSGMMSTSLFYGSGGTTVYTGLASDELYLTNTTIPAQTEFYANALSPSNSVLASDFWLRAYRYIYQANTCIENLQAATALTPAVRDRLLGEAHFLRAFHYHLLAGLFGGVPLVTGTDYKAAATMPRAPLPELYAAVVTDLQEAKRLLPASYPTAGRLRPNKWAAAALLARVYLYGGDWADAEAEAAAVIGSGTYSLVSSPANVFLAGSAEAVWQLAPVEAGFNTTEARFFVPVATGTTRPAYALTSALLAAFTPGDTRRSAWVGSKTVAPEVFYFPFKYKVRNLNLPVTENYMVLRLAEQLLIRAEARAQLGKLTEAAADLNTIRSRAGLGATPAATKDALLAAVERERRVELFAEWGHRWFDLKRTGRTDAVLAPLKSGWQPTDALFPVPQAEILRNPALTQNPGY
jgi:hypothetical protein